MKKALAIGLAAVMAVSMSAPVFSEDEGKAVCKDDLTSLICKVCCRIIASFIFTDESFLNNLRIVKTKLLFHLINSFHMSSRVTFILITDIDHSYFQVLFCKQLWT